MKLSTLRNIILNIGITSDAKHISQKYDKDTKAFMTTSTRHYGDKDSSIHIPEIIVRPAAIAALRVIQDKNPQSLGLRFTLGKHRTKDSFDDTIDGTIKVNVDKKINMVK